MSALPAASGCLLRISSHFESLVPELLQHLRAASSKPLGREFHWVQGLEPEALRRSPASILVRWNLPVHHAWPCNPQKMDGFIEKAAQALRRKFDGQAPQAILVGQLDPGSPTGWYRQLASNFRGRLLQLFPEVVAGGLDADSQDPEVPTLYCLVGREGLFAGLQSPVHCNGQHPGGTRFIAQDTEKTISRAGAKIASALHYLLLFRKPLPERSRWLELGASPGGMTSELLDRGYQVTAVDRAPLDARLRGKPGLVFAQSDVASFEPSSGSTFDAILSDLNGEALQSFRQVIRLSPGLRPGGLVVFTLKLPGAENMAEVLACVRRVHEEAATAGLRPIAGTHLPYNRHELTLFFEK